MEYVAPLSTTPSIISLAMLYGGDRDPAKATDPMEVVVREATVKEATMEATTDSEVATMDSEATTTEKPVIMAMAGKEVDREEGLNLTFVEDRSILLPICPVETRYPEIRFASTQPPLSESTFITNATLSKECKN